MPVDSLLDMARRACTRYSARITDIGDLDYDLIRPVLLKIESPEKLHQLEQKSPQLIGKDAEIWLGFIKRDIPDWHLKPHEPKDPKNWWKVYRKLKEEAREASTANEAILRAALDNIKSEKEQNTVEIASSQKSRDLAVTGGPSRRARIHYNYISGRAGSKGAHKMTLMEKIRKEARDAKASRMNRPMHELQKRATAVKEAPQRFVEDVKQRNTKPMSPPLNKAVTLPLGRTSRPPLHAPRAKQPAVDSSYDLNRDREERLRELKTGKGVPEISRASTTREASDTTRSGDGGLTMSFLEDSDDGPDEEESPRKHLKVNNDEQPRRSPSPMRIAPQQQTLKRKQAPSLFVSSPRKVVRRPGGP